jgi:Flp pilus assembly protein TadG
MGMCLIMTNQRRRSATQRDRGEATTQLVILTPILALLIFIGIQSAVYFHAANVATAAASQGAAAASASGASQDAAAVAQGTVDELGSHATRPPIVSVSDGFVSVSVALAVPQIVPFFPHTVTRTVLEPRERFVAESNR